MYDGARAIAFALDYDGARRGRRLTPSAIRRADRAMRATLAELASQSGENYPGDDAWGQDDWEEWLEDWGRGASECGDPETCRVVEWYWARQDARLPPYRSELAAEIAAVATPAPRPRT